MYFLICPSKLNATKLCNICNQKHEDDDRKERHHIEQNTEFGNLVFWWDDG
jgi:hypothetical protein